MGDVRRGLKMLGGQTLYAEGFWIVAVVVAIVDIGWIARRR